VKRTAKRNQSGINSEDGAKNSLPAYEHQSIFLAAVLSMSWQLAIVVLVPILGGYALDQQFDTSPWLTVIGFILALGGVVVVFRQMLTAVGDSSKSVKSNTDNKGKDNS
jgi:F0F1-type ATP synthase assembly protein I